MSPTESPEELEQLVDRALRNLPLHPAPRMLETRVMEALDRRLALPWWRQSFAHWPLAARSAFLALSVGFVGIGLFLWNFLASSLTDAPPQMETVAPGLAWAEAAMDVIVGIDAVLRALSASIPQLWLYGGTAAVLVLYALFFGLSAFGYRAFRPSR